MANTIVQAPRRGERIVDELGRATRKFIVYLESIESIETITITDQSIQDAIGNVSILSSLLHDFSLKLKDINNISNNPDPGLSFMVSSILRELKTLNDRSEESTALTSALSALTAYVKRNTNQETLSIDTVSWAFTSPAGSSGVFYFDGYYDFASSHDDFSTPATFGSANSAYFAHFLIVLGALTVDELTIRITGTTIDDSATRTASNTVDIVIPSGTAANAYYETTEKWIGQISISVLSGTAKDCNYGFCKYWDNHNTSFTVTGINCMWLAGANDTGADIKLFHHKTSGWVYNTGAEPSPPTAVASMATDLVTEKNLVNGENGAWKRTGLSELIAGDNHEGVIWQFTTTANKAFELGNALLTIEGYS